MKELTNLEIQEMLEEEEMIELEELMDVDCFDDEIEYHKNIIEKKYGNILIL